MTLTVRYARRRRRMDNADEDRAGAVCAGAVWPYQGWRYLRRGPVRLETGVMIGGRPGRVAGRPFSSLGWCLVLEGLGLRGWWGSSRGFHS
jgi:hypothetical protein